MYLHKFTIQYKNNNEKFFYKFCKYPKKTKLYKDLINLLNDKNNIEKIKISINN